MSVLTTSELKTLTRRDHEGPFVSIYIPTRRAGPETRENSIYLKNMIQKAEERLVDSGMRAPEAKKLLKPVGELVDDYQFWQQQNDGLALFVSSELFRTYRLPVEFDELLVVGNQFHLKPLMPLLSEDGQFYVLALSQNEVKLYEGTRFDISEVDVEELPTNLVEALRYDEPQKQQQFHTASDTPGSPATGRPAMFHGHGGGTEDEKNDILRYFQQINEGLHAYLRENTPKPLVLAGVDFLFPIYKEANTYPQLLEKGVKGNPEAMKPEALHKQAWEVVAPHFHQAQKEAVAQYEHLSNTEQSSSDIRKIVPAAHYGKIDTLFVAVDQQQWGTFDPDTNTLHVHAEPENGDVDLLDLAATQTLLKGGTIYAVTLEDVPDDTLMAAIFRY